MRYTSVSALRAWEGGWIGADEGGGFGRRLRGGWLWRGLSLL